MFEFTPIFFFGLERNLLIVDPERGANCIPKIRNWNNFPLSRTVINNLCLNSLRYFFFGLEWNLLIVNPERGAD